MIPVVLIGGEKKSGKDTFGKFFAGSLVKFDLLGKQLAFADPIKRAVGDILGVPDHVLWGESDIKESTFVYGKSVRFHLQWLGTEVFRDTVHPDVWVHKAIRDILQAQGAVSPNYGVWFITDWRFPNEFRIARDILEGYAPMPWDERASKVPVGQFKVFGAKVIRPSLVGRPKDQHRSETSVDDLDALEPKRIVNDGTLDDLRRLAYDFAKEIVAATKTATS